MNNAKEIKAETTTADVVETAKVVQQALPKIDEKKDSLLGSGRVRNAALGACGAMLMTGNVLLASPNVDTKTVLMNLGVSGVLGAATGALVRDQTTPFVDGSMAFSLGMTTSLLITPLVTAGIEAGIGAVGDWRSERAQAQADAEEFAKIQTEMNAILNQDVSVELPAIA
jgi:hypothetical protein